MTSGSHATGIKPNRLERRPYSVLESIDPTDTYVALGDSYSSGEGNPGSLPTPWVDHRGRPTMNDHDCDRSAVAYPMLVNTWLESQNEFPSISLRFLACSGATSSDLWDSPAVSDGLLGINDAEPQQLLAKGALARARIVTVSIGGNDIDFADILTNCTITSQCNSSSSDPWIADLSEHIEILEPILVATYRRIEVEAPHAALYVVGYPDLFPPSPSVKQLRACENASRTPFGFIAGRGIDYLAKEERSLESAISEAANAAGAHFIDPNSGADSFLNHDVCAGKQSWFFKPNLINLQFSYHPKTRGQSALAAQVEAAIYAAAMRGSLTKAVSSYSSDSSFGKPRVLGTIGNSRLGAG
jgi:GDSL-like Lipase/Acylhydrolase family